MNNLFCSFVLMYTKKHIIIKSLHSLLLSESKIETNSTKSYMQIICGVIDYCLQTDIIKKHKFCIV